MGREEPEVRGSSSDETREDFCPLQDRRKRGSPVPPTYHIVVMGYIRMMLVPQPAQQGIIHQQLTRFILNGLEHKCLLVKGMNYMGCSEN